MVFKTFVPKRIDLFFIATVTSNINDYLYSCFRLYVYVHITLF